ncbi:unnamed protein product [Caenorhabditis brenneri]
MQVQQIVIIGIIFCLIYLSAGEIDSALTPEERKKIVDALNKDRQEIGKQTGLNMSILTYDGTDENRFPIFSAKCILHSWYFLKGNDVVEELYASKTKKNPNFKPSLYFFDPEGSKIVCSRIQKCRIILGHNVIPENPKLAGKTAEFYGFCSYRDHVVTNWELEAKLAGVELPPISKYADILGVTETLSEEVVMAGATEEGGAQGAGNVLSIIFSLFLMIYV